MIVTIARTTWNRCLSDWYTISHNHLELSETKGISNSDRHIKSQLKCLVILQMKRAKMCCMLRMQHPNSISNSNTNTNTNCTYILWFVSFAIQYFVVVWVVVVVVIVVVIVVAMHKWKLIRENVSHSIFYLQWCTSVAKTECKSNRIELTKNHINKELQRDNQKWQRQRQRVSEREWCNTMRTIQTSTQKSFASNSEQLSGAMKNLWKTLN